MTKSLTHIITSTQNRIMKKFFFVLAALAMVVFVSCSKDEDSEPSSENRAVRAL